jgi:EAL domain-containing protein (putative c-di-GMP-specific phosphodiesterase class I)
VETAGQLSLLAQAGCDFIQGYVIARPMGASDFQTFAQGWGREGLRSAA